MDYSLGAEEINSINYLERKNCWNSTETNKTTIYPNRRETRKIDYEVMNMLFGYNESKSNRTKFLSS
jgi:hypothetical protein